MKEVIAEPNNPATKIAQLVKAKSLFRCQQSITHFRAVCIEIQKHMAATRAMDIAALEGYAELLRTCGHTVRTFTVDGAAMKETRNKTARHIFNQFQKGNTIPKNAMFKKSVADLSDIQDDGGYYTGILFVTNVARKYIKEGRKTCAAVAAHFDGVGPQSYDTTFEVVTYDKNMHLLSLLFAHFVGAECHKYWKIVLEECKNLEGFDDATRTTIVDQ